MGKMIVSLERAYHIFLAHDNSTMHENTKLTKMEYLVYSQFIRFGCNLKRFKNEIPPDSGSSSGSGSGNTQHNNNNNNDNNDSDINVDNNTSDNRLYVWNYLYDLLGHRRSILATENIDRNQYARIKQSMNGIIDKYKDQNQANPCQSNQIVSDESTEPPEKKRRKFSNSNDSNVNEIDTKLRERKNHEIDSDNLYFGSGSLNDCMIGSTFKRFKQIFDKIDVIELKTMDYDDDKDDDTANKNTDDSNHSHWPTTEKFSFDLWTSCDYRRSQFKPPNFRLIVK